MQNNKSNPQRNSLTQVQYLRYRDDTIKNKNYPSLKLYFDISRQTYIELIRRDKLEDE